MTTPVPALARTWRLDRALAEVRTPVGLVLMATAGVGVLMGAHWPPLIPVMLGLYLVTVLSPGLARRSETWFVVAAIFAIATVVRRSHMEDHVYLYIAWMVAIAVALLDRGTFRHELQQQGCVLIGVVFGVATVWKLVSGSFVNGAALWTIGLLDERMGPLLRMAGISAESLDAARPQVTAVAAGDQAAFEIELSTYASTALVLISLGTIALEALVAATHLAPDTSRLAQWRAAALAGFGIVTYAIVPVLPFAVLLAIIGSTIARGDRNAMLTLAVMVMVTVFRFATM